MAILFRARPISITRMACVIGMLACTIVWPNDRSAFAEDSATELRSVIQTYANIAHSAYEDSYIRAEELRLAILLLIKTPNEDTLSAAKTAWKMARVPYQQTEVYRFGNPIVDAWEGRVNAWPLDEGLIDYVTIAYGSESDSNEYYTANIIANQTLKYGGVEIDAAHITAELLSNTVHELGGVEANVATGYHAIEFLLWGQDLNGTGPGAGARPATDFDQSNCTGGNCDRRAEYLITAADLLVKDIQEMTAAWSPDGPARQALLSADPKRSIGAMLHGMGSLSYGELAGERMQLGLMLHDPEEEHDCFSDNTHYAHFYDQVGIENVYHGRYIRIDGTQTSGPSLSDLVVQISPETDSGMVTALADTRRAMDKLVTRAETIEAYDQMLAAGNQDGNTVIQGVVDQLLAQTRQIERVVNILDLGVVAFEGSDSLDSPDAVFQ